jgi:hypothetical protein
MQCASAKIFFAVGHSQLHDFNAGVDEIRSVMAELFQVIAVKQVERKKLCRSRGSLKDFYTLRTRDS